VPNERNDCRSSWEDRIRADSRTSDNPSSRYAQCR
jgi:hypothetical protein